MLWRLPLFASVFSGTDISSRRTSLVCEVPSSWLLSPHQPHVSRCGTETTYGATGFCSSGVELARPRQHQSSGRLGKAKDPHLAEPPQLEALIKLIIN